MTEDYRDHIEKTGLSAAHSHLIQQIREQLGKAVPEDLEHLIRYLVASEADILQGQIRDNTINVQDAITKIRVLTATRKS